jgi:large repetitive protein
MWLEDRILLSSGPANPSATAPLVLPAAVMSSAEQRAVITLGTATTPVGIAAGGVNVYAIEPTADGRLIAQTLAASNSLELRLSLYDGQGNLLVQSDGQLSGRINPAIDQHVAAGTGFIEVQSLSGSGTYSLSTLFTPSSDPGQTVQLPPDFETYDGYGPIAVGDFTNNGILDLVAPDGVHLGTGDGTFEAPAAGAALDDPSAYDEPTAIAVGNFNGDGDLDVALTLAGTDSVSISMGNGDGTFQAATTIGLPSGSAPGAIVAGDFLGNGLTDLAVADTGTNSVSILLNNGDGTFQVLPPIAVGQDPLSIAAGDFENDGRLDLAVADNESGDVVILSNQGGGNFQALPPIELPAGAMPSSVAVGNFGTGNLDLAVADQLQNVVDILQGHGDGTFSLTSSLPVGANPYSIVAGDFGNGHLDLATANTNSDNISVLLGNGNGTFEPAVGYGAGTAPVDIAAGDFNGDGRLDLAAGNAYSNDISVLLGKGNGTFEGSTANVAGNEALAVATGDFTGNGNLGLAVLDVGSNSVTILPGNGDGTFQQPLTVSLPQGADNPTSIVAADFNGDGRTDLAITDPQTNQVFILLGNGDGTFESLPPISVPGGPYALAVGDFTGSGEVDLAVTDINSSSVTILLGKGDGTFTTLPPIPLVAFSNPEAIVVGNFTADGNLDLAVASQATDTVTVLLGNGEGTFQPLAPIALGDTFPSKLSLVAGDFLNNGRTDLAVAAYSVYGTSSIDMLLGNGDGTFETPNDMQVSGNPVSIVAGDFGNGHLDLATADALDTSTIFSGTLTAGSALVTGVSSTAGLFAGQTVTGTGIPYGATIQAIDDTDGTITLSVPATVTGVPTLTAFDYFSVYLGNGDGTFQGPTSYGLSSTGTPTAMVTGDFTGTGRIDLAITLTAPDDAQVQLNNGDGTFSAPSIVDLVRRQTPLVADINGDGTPDVAVVDAAGNILYRAGRPGEPGIFAPPVTVNPGDPSRDIAFATTVFGPTIVSVDADNNAISFFVLRPTGFVLAYTLATGSEPAQILAADLDGNQITDLIVRNAGDGTISVFAGDGHGWFLPPVTLQVGLGASDVEVADLQQNGLLDIVYTNRISGEVGVLENLGGGSFGSPVLYRAGPGPYGVTGTADPSPESSLEGTTSVAAGIFTPDGPTSLVALNPGSNTFGLLTGLGGGELSNPTYIQMPASGLVVRAIDFGDTGVDGLAILTPGALYIYVANGQGGFLPRLEYNVGFEPNGLTVADLTGNGEADLLVSNPLGDVQVLMGNGNGTFQPVQNLDQQVSLAVYAPNGTTPAAFIFTDKLTDQLIVQTVGGVTTVLGDASTGLISPGAVTLADLDNNGILDLIVANSGSNNVLVFPGLGNGAFGPALNDGHGFFTGDDPVGITVADLTGNGRLDLIIANEGSNDVSILINVPDGNGGFTFEPGPRLQAGVGPVSTAVADVVGNAEPDLLIANSGSNNVWLLPGAGNGFFYDQSPIVFAVGTNPSALFVGQFTTGLGQDLVTVNSGSNSLTVITGLGTASPQTQTLASGGIDPTAAFEAGLPGFGQDLVVANNGDGNIALFEPGANGLSLSSVLTSAGLPNPSGLALASVTGGNLEFYASTDGETSASLLGFQLEEGGATSGLAGSEAGGSASLVSLNEGSLALLGTLLTISLQTTDESSSEGSAAAAAAGPGAAGQSLLGALRTPDEPEALEDPLAQPAAAAQPELSWARYVMGLDQAIESIRDEVDARLLQEAQPVSTGESDTTLLDDDTPVQPAVTTSFMEDAAEQQPGRWFDAEEERLDAVDMTIGSWGLKEPATSESLFPTLPDKSLRKSLASSTRSIEVTDRANLFPNLDVDRSQPVEIQVSRAVTMVAISAIAVKARQRWKRTGSVVGSGSSPTRGARESRERGSGKPWR